MVEEVIHWDENRGYRIRSSEFAPMPLHEMTADINIAPLASGKSKVSWSVDYRVKYGPLGWLMGQVLMKKMMRKIILANLQALADHIKGNGAGKSQGA
jgi:hypothetical protein